MLSVRQTNYCMTFAHCCSALFSTSEVKGANVQASSVCGEYLTRLGAAEVAPLHHRARLEASLL